MKPQHLSKHYGDQFQDRTVAKHYRKRPAYTPELFSILSAGLSPGARILDLGCGTGELTIPLALQGFSMTGVDPSSAMLDLARQDYPQADWRCCYAEEFDFAEPVDRVLAGNSLHWMDWPRLFSKLAEVLTSPGQLVLVTGGDLFGYTAQADVLPLVQRYSTNKDFRPYSLTQLLTQAGHIQVEYSKLTTAQPVRQTLDDFIDSFHARNGFSLERMTAANAEAFQKRMINVIEPTLEDGLVSGYVQASAHFCTVLPVNTD